MTLDLDALEARLLEYDPDASRCQKTVEEVRHYAPSGMGPDDPEYDDFKMVHRVPCCRPEGHEEECRSTRRVLGWPGYATLKELLAEVRMLRAKSSTCSWCGQTVIPGQGGHTSACYERQITGLKAELDACGVGNLGLKILAERAEASERRAIAAWLRKPCGLSGHDDRWCAACSVRNDYADAIQDGKHHKP